MGGQNEERFNERDHKHGHHNRRNLAKESAERTRDKGQRQKRHDIGQHGKQHRPGDVSGPFDRGLQKGHPLLTPFIHVFPDDHRVINHNAQGNNKGEERDHVNRGTGQRQKKKRA